MQHITADQASTMQRLLGRQPIVAMSDFDGTVCELRQDPATVAINPKAREAFRLLAGARWAKIQPGILTGRDIPTVQKLVGLPGLLYIGNHGHGKTAKFPAKPGDVDFVPEVRSYFGKTQDLLAKARQVLPASVVLEPKGVSLALNVGGCTNPEDTVQEIEHDLRSFAEALGFRWTYDVTTVEFLPDVPERDKGTALLDTVESTGARYVVFCGDSLTDLSALRAVQQLRKRGIDGIGVVAERADTRPELLAAADLRVPGVPGVADFLMEFVRVLWP
ncbi:trehalose-phosphatase [Ktedonobacter sp. SOSP1-85]|uniref:trehalose-phosphatase n=1 Tax=Ktedonobacter sp. SOSP1-85 TaxID=2778367 RepID=UPI00191569E6|nr:trehalose-phosphatase [Ktedonobacter sp. SOSP1-85]GHO76956.1 trehalose-phosphatase [Ktedonobacter sp. SOSP1-85]